MDLGPCRDGPAREAGLGPYLTCWQRHVRYPLSASDSETWRVGAGGGWTLDLDRLEAAVRPATRLVSVNFPNNPTGFVPPRATFDALVALCRRREMWLFGDEVYRVIERHPALRLPQAADAYERAHLFEWHEPDGGVTAFPRYRGPDGAERFAERAVLRAGVMVLPGSLYRSALPGAPGAAPAPDLSDRFRVGYGRACLPRALDALERALH